MDETLVQQGNYQHSDYTRYYKNYYKNKDTNKLLGKTCVKKLVNKWDCFLTLFKTLPIMSLNVNSLSTIELFDRLH